VPRNVTGLLKLTQKLLDLVAPQTGLDLQSFVAYKCLARPVVCECRSPKECGWKDGDRGGLAEWEQTHGKKKAKVCLDINRPSHGRTLIPLFRQTIDYTARRG
jgi:hypothetical protein